MDTKYLLAEALKICMKKAPLENDTILKSRQYK